MEMGTQLENTILIVDDNPDNINTLVALLSQEGYGLLIAQSGEEVFKRIEFSKPDLILLDIMMPIMDGFKVCQLLKADEKTKEIPVIFLTAKSEGEDIEKGFDVGGVDYITKPFKRKELLVRIKTQLNAKKYERELKNFIKMRDKLFSVIAHDLRGPIGNFMQAMEFLTDPRREVPLDKTKIFHQELNRIAKSVHFLLDNLLSWGKAQQNMVNYNPNLNPIKSVVNANLEFLNWIIEKKNISISNIINENAVAFFDTNAISTVIRNLLYNAIKFTGEGGKITISADVVEGFLKISIIDNGIGISKEDLKTLFFPDNISSNYGTNNEKGTGFGLQICRDYVKINGGEIIAESEFGKGSNFSFTLPLGSSK